MAPRTWAACAEAAVARRRARRVTLKSAVSPPVGSIFPTTIAETRHPSRRNDGTRNNRKIVRSGDCRTCNLFVIGRVLFFFVFSTRHFGRNSGARNRDGYRSRGPTRRSHASRISIGQKYSEVNFLNLSGWLTNLLCESTFLRCGPAEAVRPSRVHILVLSFDFFCFFFP